MRGRSLLVGIALLASIAVTGCSAGVASPKASSPGISPPSAAPARGLNCPKTEPPALPAGQTRTVTIETAKGTITIKVEADLGPLAAGNFVALASCGFYDGIVFHRVVPGFVIQGGDPEGSGNGGPGYEFANDPVKVAYSRGIVAMANAGRDTNGSQFFIVLGANSLDPDYSVFGRVTAGMEAVDAIAAAANREKPTNPVAMTKVTVSNP